ncbi:ATP synthase F(0) complex subunit C2, mitochondrial [Frankliniella fusca]|uniref:ATP synthase F(0) complex subunit C2, mitochondrial n=1 Tax=Frankliniella fusca TaxID=407009 RepID=A0AAE1H107_9NEOP|nr:ATP synthase F(0) complex subunit C2, mitochondrial [Frankliniella fusca]
MFVSFCIWISSESHGLDESLLLPPKVTVPAPSSSAAPSDPTSASVKRRSFESCSSGEAQQSQQSVDVSHGKTPLQAAISAGDAESAEKRASRMLVCASIDNERTPTRRGSLQLATESAKISLYTMSISDSKPGSRDNQDHEVELEIHVAPAPAAPSVQTQVASSNPTTPQPLTASSRSETAPAPSAVSFITSPGISTPFSTSEVAVDLLGVSFLNPPGTWRSSSTNLSGPLPPRTKKPSAFLEEEDLSSGFNHYRCLAPHEPSAARVSSIASLGRGFLKRQYSLDRGDDPAGGSGSGAGAGVGVPGAGAGLGAGSGTAGQGRGLHKQNSAGAAHDLQRIEEVPRERMPHPLPLPPGPAVLVRPRELSNVSSKSVSAESLA